MKSKIYAAIISVLLTAILLIAAMPGDVLHTLAAPPEPPEPVYIEFIDQYGTLRQKNEDDVTKLTGPQFSQTFSENGPSDGWYYWSGTGQNSPLMPVTITVDGDVSLILADGCNIIIYGNIYIEETSSLKIYSQTGADGTIGSLSVYSTTGAAGIGGREYPIGGNPGDSDSGDVVIAGGIIRAASSSGAGIGGGNNGSGGATHIYGGIVSAISVIGAGIGSGATESGNPNDVNAGQVWIHGGTVVATSNGSPSGTDSGAGIGGGQNADGGIVRIRGGSVTARSGNSDTPAIGYGSGGKIGEVVINGDYDYWVNILNTDNSSQTEPIRKSFINDNQTFTPDSNSDTNYSFIRIKRPMVAVAVTASISDITYGEAIIPSATTDDGMSYIFRYTYFGIQSNGVPYMASALPPQGPGTYWVTASIVSDIFEGSHTIPFTIHKKDLTWTSGTVKDKIYDGDIAAEVNLVPSFNGIVGDDELTVYAGQASFDDENIGTHKPVTGTGWGLVATGDYWKYNPPVGQPQFANASITEIPATPTPTPTATPTPTVSPSPSASPDTSPSPSASPDTSPDTSPSPSASPSASPGTSPTPTASPSPPVSPTPGTSPTPIPTPASSPTPPASLPPPPSPTPPPLPYLTPYPTVIPWFPPPSAQEQPSPQASPSPPPPPLGPDGQPIDADHLPGQGIDFTEDVEWISVDEFFNDENAGRRRQKEMNPWEELIWLGGAGLLLIGLLLLLIAVLRRRKNKEEK